MKGLREKKIEWIEYVIRNTDFEDFNGNFLRNGHLKNHLRIYSPSSVSFGFLVSRA